MKPSKLCNTSLQASLLVSVAILGMLAFGSRLLAGEFDGYLDLEDAYRLALKNHEQIMIAEKELAIALLLPDRSTSVMLPTVGISGGYTALEDPISFQFLESSFFDTQPTEIIPDEQWYSAFEVTQPIFEGSFFPLRRQALQSIGSARARYHQVVQDTLFEVVRAYYEVLKTEALLQNANDILNLTHEELRVSRVRFETGDVTEDVMLRSELGVTRAESRLIEETNRLQLARDTLLRLIGIKDSDVVLRRPAEAPELIAGFEEMVRQAYVLRADYRDRRLKIELARTEVDVVKTRFLPSVEAAFNYYLNDPPAFGEKDSYWAAGIKVTIPIFEASTRFLDIKEKRESLKQAELARDDLAKTIRIEIKDSMLNLKTNASLLANLDKQTQLAQKNYEIVFTKFEYGAATDLTLDMARTTLETTRTEMITKTYDQQLARLNLERAVGHFVHELIPATPIGMAPPRGGKSADLNSTVLPVP